MTALTADFITDQNKARLADHREDFDALARKLTRRGLDPETLVKEAMPLLRYRTGDIGSMTLEPCACGRTTARIRGLRGRRDDMITVRGVNLFPSNVEHLLLSVPEVAPHYQLVVERTGALDELTVQCEPLSASVDVVALRSSAEKVLREHTGIRIEVEVLEPGGVPRSEGKAVRVIDRR